MSSSICDTGRTILDFADTRATCRISRSFQGLGNVESTPIGFLQNGQTVTGHLPTLPRRDPCSFPYLKPARGVC